MIYNLAPKVMTMSFCKELEALTMAFMVVLAVWEDGE